MKKTALILLLCVLVGFAFVSCKDEPQHEHAFTKEVAAEQYLKSAATCTSKAVYYKSCECGEASSTDTFEYGELAAHIYDKEVVDDQYLKSAASCTSKAVYYKSCECGAKGTETFEYGDFAHVYDQEVVDAKYLKSAATCQAKAIYYKSCECGAAGTETFEYGDFAAHVYDQEVVDAKYLKSAASCTSKAVYYKSCECGEAGTDTFEYGDFAAHVYDQEVVDDQYLKSAASCISKAVYYKSCECGEAGTETFEAGELGDHDHSTVIDDDCYYCAVCGTYYFADDTIVICNANTGATYELLSDAISAASENDVIVLNKDVVLSAVLDISTSIVLDLNGHTITGTTLHSVADKGCLNIAGTTSSHIAKVVIKNGTISGSYSGSKASGGTVRAYLVEDMRLENISLLNTASSSEDGQSLSLYAAYCHVTINNTSNNTFKGKIAVYDNSASKLESDGYIRTSFFIKGGIYTNDTDSADPMVIRFVDAKAGAPTVIEDVQFASGTLVDASKTGISVSGLEIRQGTYCFDPTPYVGSGYSVTGTGPYVVTKD